MIDNYTTVLFGWKVSGREKVNKIDRDLNKFDDEYYDHFQDILVEDTMCGNYLYFGAILARYDVSDEEEIVINTELITKSTSVYNNIIKENPKLSKIFDKYKEGDPQLYVFQNIW